MKNLLLLLLLLSASFAQTQNLIRNGSFESNLGIPWWAGQHYLCEHWGNSSVWGSPDYYHLNGVGDAHMPETFASTVLPFDGSAVMGIFVYVLHPSTPDFREYLNQELEEPLVIGQSYQLSMYVTNGMAPIKGGGYGCDHFSVAFSTKQLFQPVLDDKYVIDFQPQYTYEGVLYNNDWQLITYSFVADAAYKHITIGSFVNDSIQQIQLFDEPSEFVGVNYYIDQVSLEATTGVHHAYATDAEIVISPNPVEDQFIIEVEHMEVDQLAITDLSGKIVYQKNVNTNAGSMIVDFDLLPGVYIVKLMSAKGSFATKKIVKL